MKFASLVGFEYSLFAPGVDVFEVLVSPSFAQAVYLADLSAARLSAAKNGAERGPIRAKGRSLTWKKLVRSRSICCLSDRKASR